MWRTRRASAAPAPPSSSIDRDGLFGGAAIFKQLDAICAPHALLCTNTSALDIDAIAAATARPHAVMGMHFFSPANVMRLCENVVGARTAPATVAAVTLVALRVGKVPVLVGNCKGFVGNRMLGPYPKAG